MKRLVGLMTASAFLGAQLFAIPLVVAKLSVYRALFLLVLAMIVLLALKNDKRLNWKLNTVPKRLVLVYIAWIGIAIVSLLWVKDISGWLKAVFFISVGGGTIWLATNFLVTKESVLEAMTWATVFSSFHHLFGWVEVLFGKYFFYSGVSSKVVLGRIPISTYGNQNDFATLILASVALSLFLFMQHRNGLARLFYSGLILSGSILIYLSDSRANLLSLVAMVGLLVMIWIWRDLSRRTINWLIGIGVGLVLVAVVFVPQINRLLVSLVNTFQNLHANDGGSNSNRLNLIMNGFVFLASTFGFGVGAGNIEYYMSNHAYFPINKINMHNWWAEIFTGYGLPFFLMYMTMYSLLFLLLFKAVKQGNKRYNNFGAMVWIAYLIAFVLSSISPASIVIGEWQWALFGLIFAYVNTLETDSVGMQESWNSQYHHLLTNEQMNWLADAQGGFND